MTAFRRRKNRVSINPPVHIQELTTTSFVENGVSVNKECVEVLSPSEYFNRHVIQTEEYSINEQISAGVSLKDIPCSTRLDSPDNLDYDVNETAEEELLKTLNDDNNDNN